ENKVQSTRLLNFAQDGAEWLLGKTLAQRVVDPTKSEKAATVLEAGVTLEKKHLKKLVDAGIDYVKINPVVSQEIMYLPADEEDRYFIAQANSLLDQEGHFADDRIEVRE